MFYHLKSTFTPKFQDEALHIHKIAGMLHPQINASAHGLLNIWHDWFEMSVATCQLTFVLCEPMQGAGMQNKICRTSFVLGLDSPKRFAVDIIPLVHVMHINQPAVNMYKLASQRNEIHDDWKYTHMEWNEQIMLRRIARFVLVLYMHSKFKILRVSWLYLCWRKRNASCR